MDGLLVVLQGLVVLGAIILGVRMGGIGLGLWGVTGTAVLVFALGLDPGSPPVAAFFIIISVITASAAMQAAGGIDFLVGLASRIIRRYPRRITFVAPLVAFVFTLGAGTGNIFFALIPVIYETAYRNGVRPERPLAAATVTSSLGIVASPVSAAMAAYLTLLPAGFGLPQILAITIPASIVACLVTSTVQQRVGKELVDDPEFLRRVESGELVPPPRVAAALAARASTAAGGGDGAEPERQTTHHAADKVVYAEPEIPAGGARSAYVFLFGVGLIVVFGLFKNLRPMVTVDDAQERLDMTTTIQLIMFTAALVILVWGRIKPGDLLHQPLLWHGFVAAVALFGIAWMADTFIAGNTEAIVEPLGRLVVEQPWTLGVAIFLVGALTTSQSTTTRTMIPIALAASLAPATVTAMWLSMVGIWLFPANGPQIAAVAIDETGTTRLTQVPVWHSFTIPMLVCWVSAVGAGLLMSLVV